MSRSRIAWRVFGGIGLLMLAAAVSCSPTFIANQTAERRGNLSITFVNNTEFRAVFTCGTYDALDKNPPGQVEFQQIRVEGRSSNAPISLGCRRNFAVGTQRLLDRMIQLDLDQGATFDADAFSAEVNFSSATADSDAASLPTEGTARGRDFLLGVDFACTSRVFVIFEKDDSAAGGFRIDIEVVLDPNTGPAN